MLRKSLYKHYFIRASAPEAGVRSSRSSYQPRRSPYSVVPVKYSVLDTIRYRTHFIKTNLVCSHRPSKITPLTYFVLVVVSWEFSESVMKTLYRQVKTLCEQNDNMTDTVLREVKKPIITTQVLPLPRTTRLDSHTILPNKLAYARAHCSHMTIFT